METEIQTAEELREKWYYLETAFNKGDITSFAWECCQTDMKQQAKERLERVGCGKEVNYRNHKGFLLYKCGMISQVRMQKWICPDCQKAYIIYEEILK